ncbi:MAG: carboxymuconolactone decarboxylase family protein, partial [Elusimicrobia bacterium]|nr:carboxymuconolactone decarboxylase family protein [Elusimicrobiota bacterium]
VKVGLTDGEMTVNEIKEVMTQLYAYCGFPRSLNALNVLMDVSKNGAYMVGPEGKPLDKDANKNKIGTKKQPKLVGKKVKGDLYTFAPAIDAYLKEHLFADIFSRGILTDQEREVATIAALSIMEKVEPQLAAHIQIGKRTGLEQTQVDEILNIVENIKNNKL